MRQTQEADTGGRHRRQTQEADTGGRHRRQTQEADTGGRHRRQAQTQSADRDTVGTDRDPPLVTCVAHLKEGAGLTSILKTQCPSAFHT
jgi:hypothetical protein